MHSSERKEGTTLSSGGLDGLESVPTPEAAHPGNSSLSGGTAALLVGSLSG